MTTKPKNTPEKRIQPPFLIFLSNKLGWVNQTIKSIGYETCPTNSIKINAQIKKYMAFTRRYDKKTI